MNKHPDYANQYLLLGFKMAKGFSWVSHNHQVSHPDRLHFGRTRSSGAYSSSTHLLQKLSASCCAVLQALFKQITSGTSRTMRLMLAVHIRIWFGVIASPSHGRFSIPLEDCCSNRKTQEACFQRRYFFKIWFHHLFQHRKHVDEGKYNNITYIILYTKLEYFILKIGPYVVPAKINLSEWWEGHVPRTIPNKYIYLLGMVLGTYFI